MVLADVAYKIFSFNAYNFGTVSPTEVPRTLKWLQKQDLSTPKRARPIPLTLSGIGAYIRLWRPTSYQTFQNQTHIPSLNLHGLAEASGYYKVTSIFDAYLLFL